VRLHDDLLAEAKAEAARSGTTLTDLIEDGLRERLARRSATHERPEPLRLPVVHGNGPRPGVDLDDSAALGDLLDGLDDPA